MQAQQFQESLFIYLQAQGWNLKKAKLLTGGCATNKNKKMPFYNYDLSAWDCNKGSQLRKVKNSVCSSCYAMKGNYTRYPAIKAAQYRRLEAIKHPDWVAAMVAVIKRQKFFRWHDAGDVQRSEHMQKILEVCRLTPDTKHWLPTQERQFLPDPEEVPDNLVIRLSRSKIDGPVPAAWSHDSGVTTGEARTCPAPDQGGKHTDCRACWNKDIKSVIYGKH